LEFNEFIGDSIRIIGVNSKYWVTAGFIGILFMIWHLKNRHNLRNPDGDITPLWSEPAKQKPGKPKPSPQGSDSLL
jgi:hypothetical protein